MIAARRNSNGVKIGASTGIARDSVIELITSEKKSPRVAGGCGGGGARCTAAFDWTGGVRREPFIKRSPRSPGTLISFRESLRRKKEEIPMQKQTTLVRRSSLAVAICAVGLALSPAALAQVTSAEGYVPPDDTPAIKVGFTLFADYTYTDSPTAKNTDGSDYNPNAFNVSRAYINITGQLHHLLSFRITPDITRETGTGSSLNGSYTFRLKYGFGQFNMDDWLPKGSWARLGLQQTPYIDYAEGIYRYPFQSASMVDRDGSDERKVLQNYLALSEQDADTSAKLKTAQDALMEKVAAKYGQLTEDEIKTLVVDDKWLHTIAAAVQGELDRVSQTLTGRIRQLAERYATPLPQLTDEIEMIAARVDRHLTKMGIVWK